MYGHRTRWHNGTLRVKHRTVTEDSVAMMADLPWPCGGLYVDHESSAVNDRVSQAAMVSCEKLM